ncbi:ornithine carbamoyltransferase [Prochlorococcus marinus]|uniref:ornithine carbamoyltransferase n=1 Tax=Prochlorococcus marinus TaxID=1219 RepID=UPI0022B3D79B|nr:ornithine carbamoyltransferase [Prochlorococcus marinus]
MDLSSQSISSQLSNLNGCDYISCSDLKSEQISALLELATQLKKGNRRIDLGNRVLGLLFSKASTRTRVSFQVAIARLGGQTIDLSLQATQVGRGEPVRDTARVLSRYCDVLAIRTYSNDEILNYAKWASIPIINALTDLEHPCQALADFLTIKEVFGSFDGLKLSYIGDGNNVANSLMICGAILGVDVHIASPKGFEPLSLIIKQAKALAGSASRIEISNDPLEVVEGAHVVYTDVWASMGQEKEQLQRKDSFQGFTVDKSLMAKSHKDSIVLHCLPAHRGEEISEEVFESNASKIFDQAENRLHVQQALLAALLGGL